MDALTYEQIKDLDKQRGLLLDINASDGTWRLLKKSWSSVMPAVLYSFDFFMCICIYVATRILARYDYLAAVDLAKFRGLHTLGVLLAFMVSFYVNTCIARFFMTVNEAMRVIARVINMALLLRGFLWRDEKEQAITRRVMDYMLAAQALGYVGLNAGYDMNNVFHPFNEEYGLLTAKELQLVEGHKMRSTARYRECLTWAMQELYQAQAQGMITPPVMSGIQGRVMDFQNAMQEIHDLQHQPIPFVSEHLLVLFLWIYLPIQTFEMGIQAEVLLRTTVDHNISFTSEPATWFMVEIFAVFLALLANFGFRGLVQVGAFIEDPYGSDLTDMRVLWFCMLATQESRAVLEAGCPRLGTLPRQEATTEFASLAERLSSMGLPVEEGRRDHIGLRTLRLEVELAEQQRAMDAAAAKSVAAERELSPIDREGSTASGLVQADGEATLEQEGSSGSAEQANVDII